MQTKDFLSVEERRAHDRMLRRVIGEGLQTSYREDAAKPLPPRLTDLLKELERQEHPDAR